MTNNLNGAKEFFAEALRTFGGDKSTLVELICVAALCVAALCYGSALKILTAVSFNKMQNASEPMLRRPDAGSGGLKHGLPIARANSLPCKCGVLI